MHANISIILSLLTISINSINCTNLCNSTESITTLSPPKKRIQPAKRIVSNNDSIEIPESRVTLENLGGGKVRKLFTGRISGWCPADFEADWAVFFFFFFSLIREHDDFTLAHPPPSINPANCSPYKFFSHPSFSSSHVQRAHDPPFPFTCSAPPQPFEKLPLLSSPLLSSKMEEVDAAGIPNCGFVFPRRYLLFHAGVHRMNEEGKLEGWTDDDDDGGSPFSPLFLPFSSSLFLLFPFSSPLPCLAFHSNGRVSLSPIEIQWWMVIGIKSCRC